MLIFVLKAERELTKNFLMLWKYKCKKKFQTPFLCLYFFIHKLTISAGKSDGYLEIEKFITLYSVLFYSE
ncbi:hypothetical protein ACM39_02965 [Chryseobacterium sp. FH2]|nr:hypothetical protein ACM39_02965 [Chryseobacterium sp. FH2]